MKIAVIAAGGNLGGRIVTEAVDRGHEVTAIIHNSPCRDSRAAVLKKSLFDLTAEDVGEFDAVISAYGSGFSADPVVNRQAMNRLAELVRGTEKRMISIAGAGCLFTDETKTIRTWELPSHPDFLKGISSNTAMGVDDVKAMPDVHFTFVTPGVFFDSDGPKTGDYLTSTTEIVPQNEDGASYTSYGNLAFAMLDFLEQGLFDRTVVTVLSRHGGK